jgi:4'-phosphopantetheinyl transferase
MFWHPPPHPVSMVEGEVHVWRAGLARPAREVAGHLAVLSPEERRRAESFYFERDRTHFIVARGVLRRILGLYQNCRPEEVGFEYGPQGKPSLRPGTQGAPALRFNVSHSRELAVYACAIDRDLGIDVEYMREDFASEEIARRFFSAREVTALRSLPHTERTHAFFNCWTRKEAYIKATGKGLSQPLDSFAVSLAPGTPPALYWVEGDTSEAGRWSFRDLKADEGYAAVVAAEGTGWELKCWQWPE